MVERHETGNLGTEGRRQVECDDCYYGDSRQVESDDQTGKLNAWDGRQVECDGRQVECDGRQVESDDQTGKLKVRVGRQVNCDGRQVESDDRTGKLNAWVGRQVESDDQTGKLNVRVGRQAKCDGRHVECDGRQVESDDQTGNLNVRGGRQVESDDQTGKLNVRVGSQVESDDCCSADSRQVESDACYSGDDESTLSVDEYDDDDDDDVGVAAAAVAQTVPTFGSVSVNHSTGVHFGNKTFYHGPVTIKQVVYATGKEEGLTFQAPPLPATGDAPPPNKGVLDLERRDALKACLGRASRRRRCLLCLIALTFLVVVVITLTLLVTVSRTVSDPTSKRHSGELTYNQPRTKYDVTLSGKLRILGRIDWLAQPSTQPVDQLNLPVPYVIISHTATEHCHSQAQCVYIVRITQTFHIESKGWSDIAYNFLVGGDGYVYTGRGWDAVGAHAYGFNTCSIGISFIGTFTSDRPTPSQFLAAIQLIDEGVRLGKISKHYKLLGHRQVSATESPGQALFDEIKALPHWLQEPLPCSQTSRFETRHNTSSSPVTIVS